MEKLGGTYPMSRLGIRTWCCRELPQSRAPVTARRATPAGWGAQMKGRAPPMGEGRSQR
jgi:hypothetical protein